MPVIREFLCGDCGATFESMLSIEEVACPQCSAPEPERVFLTPPAIKSPQTKFKDETVKQLAADYGLSNMSNRDGEAVKKGSGGAQFAPGGIPTMQVLNSIPDSARDGFSPFMGKLRTPNQNLAPSGFPFQNRTRLKN